VVGVVDGDVLVGEVEEGEGVEESEGGWGEEVEESEGG
jgi:hypothetical protein